MTQRTIDQLVEKGKQRADWFEPDAEVILASTAKLLLHQLDDERESELRQEVKSSEQSWMGLKDEYSTLARILGFEGDSWFGDPLVPHAEIVSKLKEVVAKATQADERLREVVEEVIEIIESVQLIATKKHANDTTPEKAKIVNEWLMPEVKRNIIEAVKTIDITPNTPQV